MEVRQATTLAHLPEDDTIKLLHELDAATPGFIAVHQRHLHHRGLDVGTCMHDDFAKALYTESGWTVKCITSIRIFSMHYTHFTHTHTTHCSICPENWSSRPAAILNYGPPSVFSGIHFRTISL